MKQPEHFQGLEELWKVLLAYFIKPPDLEALGFMRPLGQFAPAPLGDPGNNSVNSVIFSQNIYCVL